MKNFYITTPIYYVNDKPHIGHAYTSVTCDFFARFKRLDGFNVKFLTGTDEHGQKIQKTCELNNSTPKDFVDKVSKVFFELIEKLNISNDDFIRTTQERHIKTVQKVWKQLFDSGFIYLGTYSGWYSIRDEAFYNEDELIDKKAPTGSEVEYVSEDCYFFKLSAFANDLLSYYEENPQAILPTSRKNEVIQFIKSGLKDLCISRTNISWGVKVPNDERHVIYVWLDALTNYISALNYCDNAQEFKDFWPNCTHIIGKDILKFHAIYWPAFLMALKIDLPKVIFAHGWWTNDGQKMSKSLNNVIDPFEMCDIYSVDGFRYFLLKELSFGSDGDFSTTLIHNRYNADLCNAFGNFCQRILSFIYKNLNGIVPFVETLDQEDENLINSLINKFDTLKDNVEKYAINKYIDGIWQTIYEANKYVEDQKPWDLKKNNINKMNNVLYACVQVIKQLAILTYPIIPQNSLNIFNILNIDEDIISFSQLNKKVESGAQIKEPIILFKKLI